MGGSSGRGLVPGVPMAVVSHFSGVVDRGRRGRGWEVYALTLGWLSGV